MEILSFIITVIMGENYHTKKNSNHREFQEKDKIGTCKQTKKRRNIFERSLKHLI